MNAHNSKAFENAYAAALKKLRKDEGWTCVVRHRNSMPELNPDEITNAILAVLTEEMRVFEITAKVSEYIGRKVNSTQVADRLKGALSKRGIVAKRNETVRAAYWRKTGKADNPDKTKKDILLTKYQADILAVLDGPMTSKQISILVSRPSVLISKSMGQLHKRGIVVRKGRNPIMWAKV